MASLIHERFLQKLPELESQFSEKLIVSGLTGPLRIFQRAKGHRHSLDDATIAWYALQKSSGAQEVLDLGTGIGTVGLVVMWGLGSQSSLTCIEAQDVSYKLLQANIQCNGLETRVQALHGDLRDLKLQRKFRLITGSPPYFPKSAGILPSDSQKAHARFELRGDVGDYARAAREYLEDDGLFVFGFPFQQKRRCIDLVQNAGLKIVTVRDVVPTPGKPPLFSLYSARLSWDLPIEEEPPFIVQNEEGIYSETMREMQLSRGFGPDGTNVLE